MPKVHLTTFLPGPYFFFELLTDIKAKYTITILGNWYIFKGEKIKKREYQG